MSLTGEVPGGASALPADAQRRTLEQQRRNGLSWFYWVAALSMANSIVALTGGKFSFIFGLALTQVVDGIFMGAASDPGSFSFAALAADALIAGGIAMLGWFAIKGHASAAVFGMVLYALDGLVFLLFGDLMAAAVHAFALWGMWRGLAAHRALVQLAPPARASAATVAS
jgi:hypothetical protein